MLANQLKGQFQSQHPANSMARYHFAVSGKCLRGQLALAEGKALGLRESESLKWALACELLHNATLIHDDIQDNDPIRRGQPSLWKKYGIPQAINTGDLFIFKSFKLSAELNQPLLTQFLAQTSEQLVKGQMNELSILKHDSSGYWDSYLNMVRLKTGALFQLPVHGIHILKYNSTEFAQHKAWLEVGVAYQIYDDIRDYLGLKQKGQHQKDFQEKRINAFLAWLSREPKNQPLISEYLNLVAGSLRQKEFLFDLCTKIENDHITNDLKNYAQDKIDYFKNNTSKDTQNIILRFLNQATESPENTYEQ